MSYPFQSTLQIVTKRMTPQIKADNNIETPKLVMILVLVKFIRATTDYLARARHSSKYSPYLIYSNHIVPC